MCKSVLVGRLDSYLITSKITSDFEAPRRKLKDFVAQIVFLSILPVLRRGIERDRKIFWAND